MKNSWSLSVGFKSLAGIVVLAVLLTGCAANKVDWGARVGNYTYDQAVVELGPPDKEAKLTDATVVAEWLTRRGYRYSHPIGGYYGPCPPWYHGAIYPGYIDSYSPDYFLRLTFDPAGKLMAWREFAR